jgi:hypothetical protein
LLRASSDEVKEEGAREMKEAVVMFVVEGNRMRCAL